MDTTENMQLDSLNMTTDNPVGLTTPGSNYTALVLLFQILFPMEKAGKGLKQDSEPMDAWGQNSFSTDMLPHPTESTSKQEENNEIKKTMYKRDVHESQTSVKKMPHRIHRRSPNNCERSLAVLQNEVQKRYNALGELKKKLEDCKANNKAGSGPESNNLRAQLKEKKKEIADLYKEMSQLNITSKRNQVKIQELNKEKEKQRAKISSMTEKLVKLQKEQAKWTNVKADNIKKKEEIGRLAKQVQELQNNQNNNLDLLAQNSRKDETINQLNRQISRLKELERNLQQSNAQNYKKDQEIWRLKGLETQLEESKSRVHNLDVENYRKEEKLDALRAQMQQLQREKHACESETGIGRMIRRKHEFLNNLFQG